jgi:FdhD protein
MQKALVAGMPLLAAVGAPSSLAVQVAREFNITLVGLLRGDSFNIYAGEHRLCKSLIATIHALPSNWLRALPPGLKC